MATKKWLSKREVREKIKLSFAEISRREAKMRFPSRLRLGPHRNSRTVWWEHEIDEWMEQEAARRRIDAS
jgi:predicted DNA-binding transcriptional regulator AlpA